MKAFLKIVLSCLILGSFLSSCGDEPAPKPPVNASPVDSTASAAQSKSGIPNANSLLGEPLYRGEVSPEIEEQYAVHKAKVDANKQDLEELIWLGRFAGYKQDFREAVAVYTYALQLYPNEPRLLRHRGHRYINLRQFDLAIDDLSRAADLIRGTKDVVEQDGMPNEAGIPVSTLHGNIYYHLGVANFLHNDLPKAKWAFEKGLEVAKNDDSIVSCTHWLYMIWRRLGDESLANKYLKSIKEDMKVIENTDYLLACLYYKDLVSEDDMIMPNDDGQISVTRTFAVANRQYCDGNLNRARELGQKILSTSDWAYFAYIAAEADLARGNYK